MNLLNLSTSALTAEFLTVVLTKYVFTGTAIKEWYNKFQSVAIVTDYSSIMIGVLLGKFLFPNLPIIVSSIIIQVVHDVLFYLLVVVPLPLGHNAVIDLMKKYANQSGFGIIVYDAGMMAATVLMYEQMSSLSKDFMVLWLLSVIYGLTYIIYTKG
jgi:hypothetical protein